MFQSSDLQKRRRTVHDAARTEDGAVVRDSDGTTLLIVRKERHDGLEDAVRMFQAYLVASVAIDRRARRAAEFGPLAWLVYLDEDDQRECLAELRDALALYLEGEHKVVTEVIAAWRTTAIQLSDSTRRAILLGDPTDDDFQEVGEPTDDDIQEVSQPA